MKKQKGRRSNLPRLSSPAGIQQRLDARIKGYEGVPADIRGGFRKPGSLNRRKASR